MSLSIRNQIPATVTEITLGEAMAVVKARLSGGHEVAAAITREAVDDLGLSEGSPVQALIKSTEVSLAMAPVDQVSIRNQLPGTVARIAKGDAMSAVTLTIDGGELTAAITTEAATDLDLRVGSSVVALLKSTEVSLAAA